MRRQKIGFVEGNAADLHTASASARVAYSVVHTALAEHGKSATGMTRRLEVGLTVMRQHGVHDCLMLEACILFFGSETIRNLDGWFNSYEATGTACGKT